MGFRSRALLTGVATGFLKANNDRRDRMAERMQKLADDRATMDRERAKSQADSASKEASAEYQKWNSLRSEGHIDDEGNYQKKYFDTIAYAEFQKPETRQAYGNDFSAFAAEFAKMQPKKLVRQYKDPNEIEGSLQKVYSSIDTRQRNDLSRPAMTGFDSMLGNIVNRVSSVAGGPQVFGPPSDGSLTPTEIPSVNGLREQGPMAPETPYESPQFATPTPEADKAEKWIQKPDGSWVVAFADSTGKSTVVDPSVKGTLPEGSQGSTPTIKDMQEKRYVKGVPVPNVVEATFTDDKGVKYVKEGVMNEAGEFVHLAELSPFSDADKPQEDPQGPYLGDANIKQAQFAQDVLYSTTRATKSLSNITSMYNPRDYGSEASFSEVGNAWTALFRVTNSGFKGGVTEKDKVLSAMQKGAAFNKLPPEVQEMVLKKDYDGLKGIASTRNAEEMQETFDSFASMVTTEEEEEILSELRSASIKTEVQPLVRDLLRAWTGGDKKPAWGAAEHLLKEIKANSTPEKLIALAEVYKEDMARTSMSNLKIKFDASRYSTANNMEANFLPQEVGDIPAVEYRRNRRTGDYLMIQTGKNDKGEVVRYFLTSESKSVYEVKLPTTKGAALTNRDKNLFDYSSRLLDSYTEVLNVHGRPIN